MSIARHHAEWLSLVEASGPFLSLPVLADALPQGLNAHDPDNAADLRLAYEEWDEDRQSRRPNTALHREWIKYVLRETLGYSDRVLLEGQSIPPHLSATIAEYGETLRPDWVLSEPRKDSEELKPRLLIQYFPPGQDLEKIPSDKRWKASPATRMMELLHATGVRLGLVTNGHQWMLVNAPQGESTGFISWYVPLWFEEQLTLRAFRTLLGAERFFSVPEKETLETLLAESAINQQEVTDQLGRQVRKAVEVLVQALDAVDKSRKRQLLKDVSVTEVYDAALTIMMRLVVLFSAEERKLLLLGDEFYDQYYAVSTIREQLRQLADRRGEEVLEFRFDAWCRLLAIFRAVHGGVQHDSFQLLPYNGSLFNPDRFPFLEGRAVGTSWREEDAEPVPINNRIVLHLLEALQVLRMKGPGGSVESRRLSFRTLDVEQIGHVYEGLLDHTAFRANTPVLGLVGAKDIEPEIKLEALERERAKGEDKLVEFLKEETKRSEKTIKKALTAAGDDQLLKDQQEMQRLRTACDNEDELFDRVRPFAGLLRRDTMGYPVVITPGSIYVTEGEDRRTTGTHYTPRSLTEEIVRYALEPLVYEGVAEGKPREEWRLRSAAELLELKICDVACGSGAFLVQACRYLAERLVEAWEEIERSNPGMVVVAPEGTLSQGEPSERPLPKETDERLIVARRIVADRCLYGVDKNAMAVEMAKLSLWLITMQKDRPFTFLDHAIKWGDSLLGVTSVEQLESFALDASGGTQIRIIAALCKPLLERASDARRRLESFAGDTLEDVRRKEELHREAEEAAHKVRFVADLLIGEALTTAIRRKKKWRSTATEAEEEHEAELESIADEHEALEQLVTETLELWNSVDLRGDERVTELQVRAEQMLGGKRPFHWVLEFPEVFSRENVTQKGFDVIVGNPPFMGGTLATEAYGADYMGLLQQLNEPWHGKADLVVGFFKRAMSLLNVNGTISLVATSSILRGESLDSSLRFFMKHGWRIYSARSPYKWPGTANLEVVNVSLTREWNGAYHLDGQIVEGITEEFTPGIVDNLVPFELVDQKLEGFLGIKLCPNNREIQYEKYSRAVQEAPELENFFVPALGGEELYELTDFTYARRAVSPHKLASFLQSGGVLSGLGGINIEEPANYTHSAPAASLVAALQHSSLAFACGETSTVLRFARVPIEDCILKHKLIVFPAHSWAVFTILQSELHTLWVWRWGLRRESRVVYSPKRCALTFPLPDGFTTQLDNIEGAIADVGARYHEFRHQLMLSRQEGLTKTYNRFHDQQEISTDIQRLRELQIEMDNGVAAAYGWADIDLAHDFHQTKQGIRFTISEAARRAVLDRMLQLNHERYKEEVAVGLHDKGAKKKKASTKPKKGAKKKINSSEASADSTDVPGDGKLFDYERQSNLF